MDIKLIITNIRPNSLWCLNGNTLDDLVWYPDNTTTKPTLQECLNYWNIHGISYEMIKIREERDKKLLDSDKYTSIPDWPHETEEIRWLGLFIVKHYVIYHKLLIYKLMKMEILQIFLNGLLHLLNCYIITV